MEKIFEFSYTHKNKIFLFVCLIIHSLYILIFGLQGCNGLVALNVGSALFYVYAIYSAFKKGNATLMVTISYFEFLLFSIISELLAGGDFGFLLFPLGMVAVIFYLVPKEYSNKRFVIQLVGIIATYIVFKLETSGLIIQPTVHEKLLGIAVPLKAYNTGITLLAVTYISCVYMIELDRTRQKLDYNVNHDALTGLYNRRFFEHLMRKQYELYSKPYAVVMFDVDDFKKVNDTYGHEAGDRVLEMHAECLKRNMGEYDVAVRWGGEEFILFFPDVDMSFAEKKTIQIQNDIRRRCVEVGNVKIQVTTTAGIAVENDINKYEDAIRIADERLYYGKRKGKNCHIKENMGE